MTQRHEQIHIGRPRPNAYLIYQQCAGLLGGRMMQIAQTPVAAIQTLGQNTCVAHFLPAQTASRKLFIGQAQIVGRCNTLEFAFESCVHSRSACQRYLLFKNQLHERGEAGSPGPQRRNTIALMQLSESVVLPGKRVAGEL